MNFGLIAILIHAKYTCLKVGCNVFGYILKDKGKMRILKRALALALIFFTLQLTTTRGVLVASTVRR